MRKYIVIEKWIESYENPIVLIKDPDVDWADWVWRTSTAQMIGWVPMQILKNILNMIKELKEKVLNGRDVKQYK